MISTYIFAKQDKCDFTGSVSIMTLRLAIFYEIEKEIYMILDGVSDMI